MNNNQQITDSIDDYDPMYSYTLTRSEKLILHGLLLMSVLIVMFSVFGIFQFFIGLPEKRAEIQYLQSRVDVLRSRIIEQDEAIEKYQTALKFENLFFLVADPGQVMEFEDLEGYLTNKKQFFEAKQ